MLVKELSKKNLVPMRTRPKSAGELFTNKPQTRSHGVIKQIAKKAEVAPPKTNMCEEHRKRKSK